MNSDSPLTVTPRLIRLRDAPFYLGMDRNRFNVEVRPSLTEIPTGTQGVTFDRVELEDIGPVAVHTLGRVGPRRDHCNDYFWADCFDLEVAGVPFRIYDLDDGGGPAIVPDTCIEILAPAFVHSGDHYAPGEPVTEEIFPYFILDDGVSAPENQNWFREIPG